MGYLARRVWPVWFAFCVPLIIVPMRAAGDNGVEQVPPPNDRIYSQSQGVVTVDTAVPSAAEVIEVFGLNLYAENIQPVWLRVKNEGSGPVMLTPMGLDAQYYTARETAHRSKSGNSLRITNREFERLAHNQLQVPAGSSLSGYVFTRVDEGTKSFNVDVVGDRAPYNMTFFVPIPGLEIDHRNVNFNELYGPEELRDVEMEELTSILEAYPCCVVDSKGEDKGDPLNLVLVGKPKDLYYAFLRAGWDETETINRTSLWKTAVSAITGGRYRYSPVSALYVFDRPQDVALQRARSSIHERNHLRLWMTNLRLDGTPVWIGQISRDIGVRFTWRTITTHKIDPNVDETREFLLEDLAYAQVIEKFGFVGGVGEASIDAPRGNLTGDPYFTDGRRIIMWVSDRPVSVSEIEIQPM